MFDPLTFFATHGLKAIGAYAAGYIGWKMWPRREDYAELMRLTFVRSGLFVVKDYGDYKREIVPELLNMEQTEYGFDFTYRLFPGMSIDQFIDKRGYFNTAFNGEANIWGEGNELRIEILRNKLPKIKYYSPNKIKNQTAFAALPCPIMTRRGIEIVDIAKAPHAIVGGQSGSGKSVFERGFITTVALTKTSQQVQMSLIDLKFGTELGMFRNLPHVVGFACDVPEVKDVLDEVNQELNQRGRLFAQAGVTSLEEYNQKCEPLPYRLVVVDELAEMSAHTKLLERFSRLARFVGVHMMLCTQRPDSKVLEGAIKANCPMVFAFRTMNGVNSRILLDHDGAEKIPPIPGRCIVQNGQEYQAQALYLPTDTAKALIQPLCRQPEQQKSEVESVATPGAGSRNTIYY